MWGYLDEETGLACSYMNEYLDIQPVSGLSGCDYLIDNFLLKQTDFANYFGKLAEFLCKNYGYEIGKTL